MATEEITLTINANSAHAVTKKLSEALVDLGKGVEGASERLQKYVEELSSKLFIIADKSSKAADAMVRAYEKSAYGVGKSAEERILAEYKQKRRQIASEVDIASGNLTDKQRQQLERTAGAFEIKQKSVIAAKHEEIEKTVAGTEKEARIGSAAPGIDRRIATINEQQSDAVQRLRILKATEDEIKRVIVSYDSLRNAAIKADAETKHEAFIEAERKKRIEIEKTTADLVEAERKRRSEIDKNIADTEREARITIAPNRRVATINEQQSEAVQRLRNLKATDDEIQRVVVSFGHLREAAIKVDTDTKREAFVEGERKRRAEIEKTVADLQKEARIGSAAPGVDRKVAAINEQQSESIQRLRTLKATEEEIQHVVVAYDRLRSAAIKADTDIKNEAFIKSERDKHEQIEKNIADLEKEDRIANAPNRRIAIIDEREREQVSHLRTLKATEDEIQRTIVAFNRLRDAAIRADTSSKNDAFIEGERQKRAEIEKTIADLEKEARIAAAPNRRIATIAEREREQISHLRSIGASNSEITRVSGAFSSLRKSEEGEGKNVLSRLFSGNVNSPAGLGFRAARDLYEGRTAYGTVEFARSISSLSGAGLGIGLTVTALAAVSAAAVKAVSSLGQYGVEIKRVEIQTGLSAEQVVKFGYAAKASGGDLETYVRDMHGLSEALGDFSQRGEKGRQVIDKLLGGNSLYDASGNIKKVADLLPLLAEGFSKNADIWSRSAEAIALLRRNGISSIAPFIQLNETLKESEKLHPFNQADIDRFNQYHRSVTLLGEKWEILKQRLKEPLAIIGIQLLTKFADGDIGDKLVKIAEDFSKIAEAIGPVFVDVTKKVVDEVGEMVNSFGAVIKTVNTLIDTIGLLTGLKPPEWLKDFGGKHDVQNKYEPDEIRTILERYVEFHPSQGVFRFNSPGFARDFMLPLQGPENPGAIGKNEKGEINEEVATPFGSPSNPRAAIVARRELGAGGTVEALERKANLLKTEYDEKLNSLNNLVRDHDRLLERQRQGKEVNKKDIVNFSDTALFQAANAATEARLQYEPAKRAAELARKAEADRLALADHQLKLKDDIYDVEQRILSGQKAQVGEAQRIFDQYHKILDLDRQHGAISASTYNTLVKQTQERLRALSVLERVQAFRDAGLQLPVQRNAQGDITSFAGQITRTPSSQESLRKAEEEAHVNINRENRELTGELERQQHILESQERSLNGIVQFDRERRQLEAEAGVHVAQTLDLDQSAATRFRFASQEIAARKRFVDEEYAYESSKIEGVLKLYRSLQQQNLDAVARASGDERSRFTRIAQDFGDKASDVEDKLQEIRLKHARDESELRINLIEKAAEAQRQQLEQIRGPLESFYEKVLNKPSDFGKILGQTLKEQLTHATAGALANLTAPILQPAIFGRNGQGGIASVFNRIGQPHSPIEAFNAAAEVTRQNNVVTAENNQLLRAHNNLIESARNKEQSETFKAGTEALQAKDFQTAIREFEKSFQVSGVQQKATVAAHIGEAYEQFGAEKQPGPEQKAAYGKGLEAYERASKLAPENPAYATNYAAALVRAGQIAPAQEQIARAARLQPETAGQAYLHFAGLLAETQGQTQIQGQIQGQAQGPQQGAQGPQQVSQVNVSSQANTASIEAYRKSIALDPNNPEAHYYLGTALAVGAPVTKTGSTKLPDESTKELQKYLELKPTGQFAQSARELLVSSNGINEAGGVFKSAVDKFSDSVLKFINVVDKKSGNNASGNNSSGNNSSGNNASGNASSGNTASNVINNVTHNVHVAPNAQRATSSNAPANAPNANTIASASSALSPLSAQEIAKLVSSRVTELLPLALPHYQSGGMIGQTGMAVVHEGEYVVQKKDVDKLRFDSNESERAERPERPVLDIAALFKSYLKGKVGTPSYGPGLSEQEQNSILNGAGRVMTAGGPLIGNIPITAAGVALQRMMTPNNPSEAHGRSEVRLGAVGKSKLNLNLDFIAERAGASFTVKALDEGKVVGQAEFAASQGNRTAFNAGKPLGPNQIAPRSVDVAPELRRQGVATKLYDYARSEYAKAVEKPVDAVEIVRSPVETKTGKAFHEAYERRGKAIESTRNIDSMRDLVQRADGGPIEPSQRAITGERGAELYDPLGASLFTNPLVTASERIIAGPAPSNSGGASQAMMEENVGIGAVKRAVGVSKPVASGRFSHSPIHHYNEPFAGDAGFMTSGRIFINTAVSAPNTQAYHDTSRHEQIHALLSRLSKKDRERILQDPDIIYFLGGIGGSLEHKYPQLYSGVGDQNIFEEGLAYPVNLHGVTPGLPKEDQRRFQLHALDLIRQASPDIADKISKIYAQANYAPGKVLEGKVLEGSKIEGRSSGGPVVAGNNYIAGELGAEPYIPKRFAEEGAFNGGGAFDGGVLSGIVGNIFDPLAGAFKLAPAAVTPSIARLPSGLINRTDAAINGTLPVSYDPAPKVPAQQAQAQPSSQPSSQSPQPPLARPSYSQQLQQTIPQLEQSLAVLMGQRALFGSQAGSGGGIVSATISGAILGGAEGHPLLGATLLGGAAIGEKIAGVEPRFKEAERVGKNIFGSRIDKQQGEDIIKLADDKYKGHVDIAVQSPEGRLLQGIFPGPGYPGFNEGVIQVPQSTDIGRRENGGPLKPNERAVVGERGPEIHFPAGVLKNFTPRVLENKPQLVGKNGPEVIQAPSGGVIIPAHETKKLRLGEKGKVRFAEDGAGDINGAANIKLPGADEQISRALAGSSNITIHGADLLDVLQNLIKASRQNSSTVYSSTAVNAAAAGIPVPSAPVGVSASGVSASSASSGGQIAHPQVIAAAATAATKVIEQRAQEKGYQPPRFGPISPAQSFSTVPSISTVPAISTVSSILSTGLSTTPVAHVPTTHIPTARLFQPRPFIFPQQGGVQNVIAPNNVPSNVLGGYASPFDYTLAPQFTTAYSDSGAATLSAPSRTAPPATTTPLFDLPSPALLGTRVPPSLLEAPIQNPSLPTPVGIRISGPATQSNSSKFFHGLLSTAQQFISGSLSKGIGGSASNIEGIPNTGGIVRSVDDIAFPNIPKNTIFPGVELPGAPSFVGTPPFIGDYAPFPGGGVGVKYPDGHIGGPVFDGGTNQQYGQYGGQYGSLGQSISNTVSNTGIKGLQGLFGGLSGIFGSKGGVGTGGLGIGAIDRIPGTDIGTIDSGVATPGAQGGLGGGNAHSFGLGGSNILSSFGSSAAGFGLQTIGTALIKRGLFGHDEGTFKGAFEGAGGGAAIGFQYGGPIGAAIGAGVGLSVGLGEVAFGVEPQWREAIRLVKSSYNIKIPEQVGQQIADIANQKYGHRVSIAVNAPEVRQLLEIYSAGSGQSFKPSALTPHGAILVENQGQLQQEATYKYGNPYTYKSNLPVEGGLTTGTYAVPGFGGAQGYYDAAKNQPSNQPVTLQLHVDGKGAGQFLAGSVVTSDYVSAQWSQSQQNSNNRISNMVLLGQPGLIPG